LLERKQTTSPEALDFRYEFDDHSLASVEAHVVDPRTGVLQATTTDHLTGCG
jgi:hypothetical protein